MRKNIAMGAAAGLIAALILEAVLRLLPTGRGPGAIHGALPRASS